MSTYVTDLCLVSGCLSLYRSKPTHLTSIFYSRLMIRSIHHEVSSEQLMVFWMFVFAQIQIFSVTSIHIKTDTNLTSIHLELWWLQPASQFQSIMIFLPDIMLTDLPQTVLFSCVCDLTTPVSRNFLTRKSHEYTNN